MKFIMIRQMRNIDLGNRFSFVKLKECLFVFYTEKLYEILVDVMKDFSLIRQTGEEFIQRKQN